VFAPMFIQGLRGMSRRMADGGTTYFGADDAAIHMNKSITHAAVLLGIAQLPFILNLFMSIKGGRKVEGDNPWGAVGLEWNTTSPPPTENFTTPPVVTWDAYEHQTPVEGHVV